MNKEQLLALGLNEEQATKVLDAYKGSVPYSRFYEVNEAKKTAESNFSALEKERDSLKAELEAATKTHEKATEKLNKELSELKASSEKQLNALKISNAVDNALTKFKARDNISVKAHLDMTKISLDGEKVKGLEDQLEKLTKDEKTAFLFETSANTSTANQAPKGTKGADSSAVGAKTGGGNLETMTLYDVLAAQMTPKES